MQGTSLLAMVITLAFSPSFYPTYLTDRVPNLATESVFLLVALTNCGCLSCHNPLRHQSKHNPVSLSSLLDQVVIHVEDSSQERVDVKQRCF